MLDWTTSFLSDETIIKPKNRICQIVFEGLDTMESNTGESGFF
jgi:hypothetical protein